MTMCDYSEMAMTGNNIQLAMLADTGNDYGIIEHDGHDVDA